MLINRLLVLLCVLCLNGCIHHTLEKLDRIGKAPALDKVAVPQNQNSYEEVEWPDKYTYNVDKPKKMVNSLWQPDSRSFFRDHKVRRVGDIVKVNISFSDQASFNNQTSRKRKTTDNFLKPKIFGLQDKLPNALGESNPLELSGGNSNSGSGSTNRAETINTEIASTVAQVLPNGNVVLHGKQEIVVNFEKRQLFIQGIVRSEDIDSNNTVESAKVAELRLSYGGKGDLTDVQQPRVGSQMIDILSPF